MLQFVLGRACSGKSHYIVSEAAKNSLEKSVVVIVPEQFSFETERAVLRTDNFNSDNISVMSFTKLYDEVSRTSGFGRLPVMSESERFLLCDIAIKNASEQLCVFDKFKNYTDFSREVANIIRDFKYAAVSSEEIFSASESIGGSCGAKLHDIAIIMSVYESLISDKFLDSSDYLTRLYDLLLDIDYFKNKNVFFDSFTGFTGQQFKVIEKIIEQCDNLTVSLCSDNIDSADINIFYNINNTAKKIKNIALSRGVEIASPIVLNKNYYSNQSLINLEKSFISSKSDIFQVDEKNGVRIISCENPRQEAIAATSIVKNLVNKEGYRYRDFIIVARNAEDYKNYIESFCEKSEIQCFFDKKIRLIETFIYIYINSLLNIKLSFTTDNILSWLKCGIHNYSFDDICALEEYIYVWNIRSKDWAYEWKMNPAGLETGEIKEEDKKQLEKLNFLREDIYKKLSAFCDGLYGSARDWSENIYKFLESEKVSEKLISMCSKSENENDSAAFSILRQAWDELMKILDSLSKILKGNVSPTDFYNSFVIAARAIEIATVPQMLDEVTFGSADRIRPSKPKVALILGANQGIFPNTSVKSGILIGADKQKLEEYGISLNDDEIKSAVEENYLVYSMLCCPVDKSYILFSNKTIGGAELQPSSFISTITEKLDNAFIENYDPFGSELFAPPTKNLALYLMGELYGEEYETVKQSLCFDSKYSDAVNRIDNMEISESFNISPENSDALFGENIYISASKFDNFHTCRLLYFLKYGLKAQKIKPADLNAAQRGTLIHYIFESLIKKYGKDFGQLNEREISKEIDLLVEKYITMISGSEIINTPRFNFLLSKIAKSAKVIAYHLAEEFRQSGFEPAYCELEIGFEGELPAVTLPIDKGEIVLTGKVDRVDTFKNVIRIVDYKTNSKKFDFSDTLFGLNMQMLIYLYAILKNKKQLIDGAKAGGILYLTANKRASQTSLAMNGLILDDAEVIEAMDSENSGRYIPEYNNKNQSFIDEETFELVFNKIEELMSNMGGAIRKGDFKPEPIDGINSSACHYCEFASVCRKSEKEHFKVKNLKNSQIKEILKGGVAGEV